MKKRNLLKALLAATLVCATVVVAGEGTAAVKGNPKSKIYHKPTCKHYTAKGTTVEFKSEAEAKKAGYTGCKKCCPTKKKTEKPVEKKTEKKAEVPKEK